MVPVPEYLVGGVERFLMLKSLMTSSEALNRDSVARMLPSLNSRCRTAFSVIAQAKLSRDDLSISELAAQLHWTEHETVGVVHELCQLVWAVFGSAIVVAWNLRPDGNQGTVDWSEQTIFATTEIAEAVVAAEGLLAEEATT